MALGEQNVLRLDVAVHDPLAMRVVQRIGHLGGNAQRLMHRQHRRPLESGAQRFSLDQRHDVEGGRDFTSPKGDGAAVEQGENVGVAQSRGDGDLSPEALDADRPDQLGVHQLDRDPPMVPLVLGEIDCRHPASADQPFDAIAAREGRSKEVQRFGSHLRQDSAREGFRDGGWRGR